MNLQNQRPQDKAIHVERSSEFIAIAHKVRDHINALPLSNDQHNRLVELITEQVVEAESTALKQGFDMGMKVMQHLAECPESAPVSGPLQ